MNEPKGFDYKLAGDERQFRYVTDDRPEWADWRGWIAFKHPDGHWVSYRKPGPAEKESLEAAMQAVKDSI